MIARYAAWAEDYGGNGDIPEGSAHCYFCAGTMALHLEIDKFACWKHCRCDRGRVA